MPFPKFFKKNFLAQTAVEIAVFGAILMFVLAVMVRHVYNANFTHNQALRVMRMALSESFRTSAGGLPARNTASIIVIEDHLTPSIGKYGPETRTPFVLAGSGSHSRELFMPMDEGSRDDELPRIDMFINGQHFVFTTAGYKLWDQVNEKHSPPFHNRTYFPGGHPDFDERCAEDKNNPGKFTGCRRFFKIVPNYIQDTSKNLFCCEDQDRVTKQCRNPGCQAGAKKCCDPDKNLSADQRFDLDRDIDRKVPPVPPNLRPDFAWQWYLVKAFIPKGGSPFQVQYGDVIDPGKNKNLSVDVDRDLKEEIILVKRDRRGRPFLDTDPNGAITNIRVLDFQEGDLDLSGLPLSGPGQPRSPRPGLQDDVTMYTYSKDVRSPQGGTYLLIEEGKLFENVGSLNEKRQFVRAVQKRDRIDLIERKILLSNDTGRFCEEDRNNQGQFKPRDWVDENFSALRHPNPVEACDDCHNAAKRDRTCLERSLKTIFVRSRLRDLGGRKWVTPMK